MRIEEINFNGYEGAFQNLPMFDAGMKCIMHKTGTVCMSSEEKSDCNAFYEFVSFFIGTYQPLDTIMRYVARSRNKVLSKYLCKTIKDYDTLLSLKQAFDFLKTFWKKGANSIVQAYDFPVDVYNSIIRSTEGNNQETFIRTFEGRQDRRFFGILAILQSLIDSSPQTRWPNYNSYFVQQLDSDINAEEVSIKKKKIRHKVTTISDKDIIIYYLSHDRDAFTYEPSWLDDWNKEKQTPTIFLSYIYQLEDDFDTLFRDFRFVNESFLYGLNSAINRHDPNDERALYLHDRKDTLKQMLLVLLYKIAKRFCYANSVLEENELSMISLIIHHSHYRDIIAWFIEQIVSSIEDGIKYELQPIDNFQTSIHLDENEFKNLDYIDNIPEEKLYVKVLNSKIKGDTEDERLLNLEKSLELLYEELTKVGNNLIDYDTPKELFLYRFSGKGESYPLTTKIKWRGKNVLLGHIIRCLLSDTKYAPEDMGVASDFFESKSGKPINLATAKQTAVNDFEKERNSLNSNFVEAVELLRRCGFINVEYTSKRR